ncbi:MAG: STN domain-containing protein [Cyclobacteriaceae bacterium]|nr:STN domain-containing protein [Cyclobacteriaceae bacterium]
MKILPLFLVCLLSVCPGQAQVKTSILDRKISLEAKDETISIVLGRLAREGKFSFSYNAAIIGDQTVSVSAVNKTVREILNELFKGSMNYKEKSEHLILTKVPVRKASAATTSFIISGYVEDAVTKARLTDASVYSKKSVSSVITDEYGFFRMRLDVRDSVIALAVSKRDYRDTVVTFTTAGLQYLVIPIYPIVPDSTIAKQESQADSTHHQDELNLPYDDEPNVRNIRDTLYRDVQISFLPFLGSNGRLSGNVINNYSINVLGGYSLGTRQIELGFFFNMDRGDVSWLQVAGFGNLTGGNMYGVQASGFFNVNGGETKAVQATGFGNVNFKDFQGVQVAGFGNVNLTSASGVRVAGFANYANGRSEGVQIAGFANVQLKNFRGPQIAGFANIATDRIAGSQIAGFFNYGRNVRGTQIGFINYADTLRGAPIGFLSFVRSGYHKLEISADEVFYTNVAFRTGARKFYNIVMAGIKPESTTGLNESVWTFGYGLGSARRITRWLHLNIDLTSQHVNKGSFTNALSLLNKAHIGLDFRLARRFSIYGGATFNGYLTSQSFTDYPVLFTDFTPSIVSSQAVGNNNNLQTWWGWKVGLRFL